MALVPCRECGKEISDEAPGCPDCGAPQLIGQAGEQSLYARMQALQKMPVSEFDAHFKKENRNRTLWFVFICLMPFINNGGFCDLLVARGQAKT